MPGGHGRASCASPSRGRPAAGPGLEAGGVASLVAGRPSPGSQPSGRPAFHGRGQEQIERQAAEERRERARACAAARPRCEPQPGAAPRCADGERGPATRTGSAAHAAPGGACRPLRSQLPPQILRAPLEAAVRPRAPPAHTEVVEELGCSCRPGGLGPRAASWVRAPPRTCPPGRVVLDPQGPGNGVRGGTARQVSPSGVKTCVVPALL